jgi:hypothetical protein
MNIKCTFLAWCISLMLLVCYAHAAQQEEVVVPLNILNLVLSYLREESIIPRLLKFPLDIQYIVLSYLPDYLEIPFDDQYEELHKYVRQSITDEGTLILEGNGYLARWNPLDDASSFYEIPTNEMVDRIKQGKIIIAEDVNQEIFLKVLAGDTFTQLVRFAFPEYYTSSFEMSEDGSTIAWCKHPVVAQSVAHEMIVRKIDTGKTWNIREEGDGFLPPLIVNHDGTFVGAHEPRTFQLLVWNVAQQQLIARFHVLPRSSSLYQPSTGMCTLHHRISLPCSHNKKHSYHLLSCISQGHKKPLAMKVFPLTDSFAELGPWVNSRGDLLLESRFVQDVRNQSEPYVCILSTETTFDTAWKKHCHLVKKMYHLHAGSLLSTCLSLDNESPYVCASSSLYGTTLFHAEDEETNSPFMLHEAGPSAIPLATIPDRLKACSFSLSVQGRWALLPDRLMCLMSKLHMTSLPSGNLEKLLTLYQRVQQGKLTLPPSLKQLLIPNLQRLPATVHRSKKSQN